MRNSNYSWLLFVVPFAIFWMLLDFLLGGLSAFDWHYSAINIVSAGFAAFLLSTYCFREATSKFRPLRGFIIGLYISLCSLFFTGLVFGLMGLLFGYEEHGLSMSLLDGALWVSLMNMIFAFMSSPLTLFLGGVIGALYYILLHSLFGSSDVEQEKPEVQMSWAIRQLLFTSISAAAVWYSLLIPIKVESREELKEMKFGYPISYVVQNQSGYSYGYPPESPGFPLWLIPASPWENGTSTKALPFLFNILLVYTGLGLLSYTWINKGGRFSVFRNAANRAV